MKIKIKNIVCRLAWLVPTLMLVPAQAATLYVSTSGSDSNPGTSSQPFRTITYAYSKASAGTTILVAPGTYTDYQSGWGLHLGRSGTASNPIILESQVRGTAIIDGQNASDRNEAIYIDGNYNVVEGFEIKNGPNGGISIWGNGNQILDNEIDHNGNPASSSSNGHDGVYENESVTGNVFAGNYIHDNGRTGGSNLDHGLYLCGNNDLVINNVSIRNDSSGLQIAGYTTVNNMKVYNNVFAWNGTQGMFVWQDMNGVEIKNNIIYHNGQYGIDFYAATGSGVVVDHNLIYGNGSGNYTSFSNGGGSVSVTQGTTISSDPKFANETSSGFDAHLSSGSPAIGAGLNLSSTFTTDIAGASRPGSGTWDLGAYVYGSSSPTSAPPTVSISSPANGATVSGTINVSANATDSVGVTNVQFTWDGADLGSALTAAPYTVSVNTTTAANGSHTLSAVARDAAGNQATASAVTIQVNNPVNTAPNISSIASQTVTSGSVVGPLAFTVSDAETAAGNLSVTASSSAPALLPNANIVLGGSGGNRTVTLTPAPSQTGTTTVTLTVSDGQLTGSTSFQVTVNALPTTNGLTFASISGVITAPFVVGSGVISQPAYTSLSAGGSAVYNFSVTNAGDYIVTALVNAPNTDENSFFVNIDGEPTDPTMIWDIPVTSGLAAQTVSWRGNGVTDSTSPSGMSAQFAPKVFTLAAGAHQLIVRGREGNVQLGTITIAAVSSGDTTPPSVSITSPTSGATVSGMTTVSASASDNVGVAGVQFKLDGVNLGAEATSAPFSVAWDTTSSADGSHTLTAVARDAAGNQTTAASVTVNVSNSSQTGLPTVTVAASVPNASRVGPDNGQFTFTRTGSTSSPLTVNFALGGTAVNGVDFVSLNSSVAIPAGAASVILPVQPLASTNLVDSATAVLTLSANSAYTVGSANSATVTIAGNSVPSALHPAPKHSMSITWDSLVGKTYHVAFKNTIMGTTWTDLSGPITATATTTSYIDNGAGGSTQRYYIVYVVD